MWGGESVGVCVLIEENGGESNRDIKWAGGLTG